MTIGLNLIHPPPPPPPPPSPLSLPRSYDINWIPWGEESAARIHPIVLTFSGREVSRGIYVGLVDLVGL